MPLTTLELLRAAIVAEQYPAGCGSDWGSGPLQPYAQTTLPRLLKARPELWVYG